jgi:Flp pilus assembly pilin Flp
MLSLKLLKNAREPATIRRQRRGLVAQALREEEGQGTVEYALIMLLIAIALIAGLTGYQTSLSGAYAWITESIANAGS